MWQNVENWYIWVENPWKISALLLQLLCKSKITSSIYFILREDGISL
jgi:hypothetical protein